jgi:hypothetical protein
MLQIETNAQKQAHSDLQQPSPSFHQKTVSAANSGICSLMSMPHAEEDFAVSSFSKVLRAIHYCCPIAQKVSSHTDKTASCKVCIPFFTLRYRARKQRPPSSSLHHI